VSDSAVVYKYGMLFCIMKSFTVCAIHWILLR